MKSKQSIFIIAIIAVILLVVGLGVFMNKASGPSKYDAFAQSLSSSGAKFYGAFWCPHCQSEKALFGSAKQYLPYIECSNPDNTTTQVCLDNKIESFPTWRFKDSISVESMGTPIVCAVSPGVAGEVDVCKRVASKYDRTWIFPEYKSFSIKSSVDPVKDGTTWKFPATASFSGEVPLEILARQIKFILPQ